MSTLAPKPNEPNPIPYLTKEASTTKEFGGLTREQVLGLEPITREELVEAIRYSRDEVKRGRYTELPKTYAEFRKVILGKADA